MPTDDTRPDPCVFVPPHEPWECSVHRGVRTSLNEPQCDIARPAEPLNEAHLDNLRRGIAEGRNPGSRYVVRRLLATIEAATAATDRLAAELAEARAGYDDADDLLARAAALDELEDLLAHPDGRTPKELVSIARGRLRTVIRGSDHAD